MLNMDIYNIDYSQIYEQLKFEKGRITKNGINFTIDENLLLSKVNLTNDIYLIKKNLCSNQHAPIFIIQDCKNQASFSILIFGGDDTPYQNCGFKFYMEIPNDYPFSPPQLFLDIKNIEPGCLHPNIVENGLVISSLLGTINDTNTELYKDSEKWDCNKNLLILLNCIRCYFLTKNPFFTNPNNNKLHNTNQGKLEADKYTQLYKMVAVAEGICNLINNDIEFKEIISIYFMTKTQIILKQLDEYEKNYNDTYDKKFTHYKNKNFKEWINETRIAINKFNENIEKKNL